MPSFEQEAMDERQGRYLAEDEREAWKRRAQKAEKQLERLRELGHKLEDHVRVLESLLRNGGPDFTPVPATSIQRENALRDREKWLVALAELEKGEASFRRSKEAELPIRVSPDVRRNVGLRQPVEGEKP